MRSRSSGVTVLELLLVLALLAVLYGLAAPMARQWIDRVRWQVAVGEALSHIAQARVLAIRQQGPVTWCASSDGRECNKEWRQNWLMFIDHNGNGVLDAEDQLLRQQAIGLQQVRIDWRSFRQLPYLQFTPDGLGNSANGTLLFCDLEQRPGWDRKIVVNRIGRARMEVARPDGRLRECQK